MKPKPAVRLNPLPKLKVKNPYVKQEPNPCLVSLTVLLNCWASNGEGSVACQPGETELKQCMDTYKPTKSVPSNINYHAQRLYPKIGGKRKEKK